MAVLKLITTAGAATGEPANRRAGEMKTVTFYESTYTVRESHELSRSELNELTNLLDRISTAEGQAVQELITAFLKILLPDLTEAELSSDDETCAMLFQKTYQEFAASLNLSDRINGKMLRVNLGVFPKRLST